VASKIVFSSRQHRESLGKPSGWELRGRAFFLPVSFTIYSAVLQRGATTFALVSGNGSRVGAGTSGDDGTFHSLRWGTTFEVAAKVLAAGARLAAAISFTDIASFADVAR